MPKRYRSGWWLFETYHIEGLTQAEIADECGVSPRAIRKWMDDRGIETREISGENHPQYGTERSADVKEQISDSLEGREFSSQVRDRIAQAKTGHSPSMNTREKISRTLRGRELSDATRRKMARSRTGKDNPNWRGGRVLCYGAGWTHARREARESVDECEQCNHDGSRYRLEVHHIVPVRRFRDSENHEVSDAHVQENLAVLCKRCHGRADHGSLTIESKLKTPIPDPDDE